MLNFLRSELYRALRQRGIKVFMLCCLAILLVNALLAKSADQPRHVYLESVRLIALLACMSIFPAIFIAFNRKERGIHVQMISFGTRRPTILFGDYLILIFELFVAAALLVGATLAIAQLLPEHQDIVYASGKHRLIFVRTIAHFYLLVLPLLAMALGLIYLLNNPGLSIAVFFTVGFIMPLIMMRFVEKRWVEIAVKLMPANHMIEAINGLSALDYKWLGLCIGVNIIGWLTLAMVSYQQKEI